MLKPFTYSFHVRVPGYAQRTGKRLFIQPAFFQRGQAELFSAAARKNLIYFSYPWSEQDEVDIELPAGYAFDNPDAPAQLAAGEISKYDVHVYMAKDGHALFYRRSFFFGGGDRGLIFPVESYPALKQLFDEVHKRDDHTITLKQGMPAAAATPAKPAQ